MVPLHPVIPGNINFNGKVNEKSRPDVSPYTPHPATLYEDQDSHPATLYEDQDSHPATLHEDQDSSQSVSNTDGVPFEEGHRSGGELASGSDEEEEGETLTDGYTSHVFGRDAQNRSAWDTCSEHSDSLSHGSSNDRVACEGNERVSPTSEEGLTAGSVNQTSEEGLPAGSANQTSEEGLSAGSANLNEELDAAGLAGNQTCQTFDDKVMKTALQPEMNGQSSDSATSSQANSSDCTSGLGSSFDQLSSADACSVSTAVNPQEVLDRAKETLDMVDANNGDVVTKTRNDYLPHSLCAF